MSRDQTTKLTCPNCGYDLGEENLFRHYERKVATWLDGEVAAMYNPDFDVYNCSEFPDLTFQVKYSNAHFYRGRFKVRRWAFSQYRITDGKPDYYILVGIAEDGGNHYFLLRRKTFMELSSKSKGDARILITVPYPFSRRGGGKATYLHENKFWKYQVKNPEANLLERIRDYESFKQEQLF